MLIMNNILSNDKFLLMKEDNENISSKIMDVYNNDNYIKDGITNNMLNISQLKEENKEQKITINKLENNIIELKEENKEQKITINKLENKVKYLENKVEYLENKIEYLENKDYIKKIMYALQDLNSKESLEKILKIPFNKLICKMRNHRNDDCHYILNNDDNDIILCKEKVLYDILKNLDKSQRQLLNKKINSILLIDEIIKFLESKSYISINHEDYEYYNSWFED